MSELSAPSAAIAAAQPSAYLRIKHAQALFNTAPEQLTPEQLRKLDLVVARQHSIEARILGSRQAAQVTLAPHTIEHSLSEISGRFQSEAEFICDLARNGMTLETLRKEIERELRVEAILSMVSAKVPPVSNMEVELFYHLHFERFQSPERRSLRHILITINEGLKGNGRSEALARIEGIRTLLERQPDRFAEQALRHSECPTAMQGGLLGQVPRGQLFPALETAAFAMRPGGLSGVLESPLGFHILRCENIQPAHRIPVSTVRDRIREQMLEARRQNKQRAWLKKVLRAEG